MNIFQNPNIFIQENAFAHLFLRFPKAMIRKHKNFHAINMIAFHKIAHASRDP